MALDDVRHPDAERLAEYAEGVLDVAARTDVERHLADCADCRAVVTETMAFLKTAPEAGDRAHTARVVPFRSRRLITIAAGLATAAALVLAIRVARPEWVGGLFGPRGDRPELQELIAAVAAEPTRPVEGRVSGGFKYAPIAPARRGTDDRIVPADIKVAAAKVAQAYAVDPSAQNAAAAAIAYLQIGEIERAVDVLERVVQRAPERASAWSDLSAAYLARRRNGDDARATAAADRALRLVPGSPEALFNKALASGSGPDAGVAWRAYVAVDPSSPWAAEARRRFGAGS